MLYIDGSSGTSSPYPLMSSRTGRDTPDVVSRNRERISIRSLTSQPQTSSPFPSPAQFSLAPNTTPFFPRAGRSTSGSKGYQISIAQEPKTGAAHGPHYLSRVPLAPALIVRLDVVDMANQALQVDDEIPFFVATLSLLDEAACPIRDPPDDPMNSSAQPSAQRLLYGSLVSSPYSLVDLSGRKGMFFVFPDVSVRIEGKFRLGISLTRLRDHESSLISSGFVTPVAQTCTNVFTVIHQSQYVAPQSTQLSLHFRQQGVPRT